MALATSRDWPNEVRIGSDFRHARKHGYGFIADVSGERLFLVPRPFEEPDWGLAVYYLEAASWRDLGDLEPTPEHWVFPAVEERPTSVG